MANRRPRGRHAGSRVAAPRRTAGGGHAARRRLDRARARAGGRVLVWSALLPLTLAAIGPQSSASPAASSASSAEPASPTALGRPGADPFTVPVWTSADPALLPASLTRHPGPAASTSRLRGPLARGALRRGSAAGGWTTAVRGDSLSALSQASMTAFRAAQETLAVADPSCHLSWSVLAGIQFVEGTHARGGRGPMSFGRRAWAAAGVDGDGDGRRDVHDLDDAALAAAAFLCVGERDLATRDGLRAAMYRFNHSGRYGVLVAGAAAAYAHRYTQTGDGQGPGGGPAGEVRMASGPGVAVGLGEPGVGVLVGGSGTGDDRDDNGDGEQGGKRHDAGTRPRGGNGPEHHRPEHHRPEHHRPEHHRTSPHEPRHHGTDQHSTDQHSPGRGRRGGDRGSGRRDNGDRTDRHDGPADGRHRGRSHPAPRPSQAPSPRPDHPGHGSGGGRGDDGPRGGRNGGGPGTKTPQPTEFSGVLTQCRQDQFCLDAYRLVGGGPYDARVGQTITVLAVRSGTTLNVTTVVG